MLRERKVCEQAHHLYLESEICRHGCERAEEFKHRRDENSRLKGLVADLSLDEEMFQSVI